MHHENAPWKHKTDLTEKCNNTFQDRIRIMYFLDSSIPDILNYHHIH